MSTQNPRGAGRKPSTPELKKIPVGVKLPRWLVEWMRAQSESQAVLIEEALKARHKLKPPEGVTVRGIVTEAMVLKAVYESGLHQYAPGVLRTSWKDGIDLDVPCPALVNFAMKICKAANVELTGSPLLASPS